MSKKIKTITLSVIGIIVVILLYLFGPVLLDRVIGVADRSTRGTFKDRRYTYRLSSKSDILPFDIKLLPDTDIDNQRIHAIVSFHYYTITGQKPTEHRYYEFTDDGSVTISNNLLFTEMANNNEDFYFTCRNSNANFVLLGNYADEDLTEFYYLNHQKKEPYLLFSNTYNLYEPIAIGDYIYWSEINELDDEHELSHIVKFNPKDNSQTNLITRSGSIDLLAVDGDNILSLGLNYEDSNDDEYLYRYNTATSKLDSVSVSYSGSYITCGYLNKDSAYFPILYDEEEDPYLGRISFNSDKEAEFIQLPLYKDARLTDCNVGGNYALLQYEKDGRRINDKQTFTAVMSLESGEIVKTIQNIGGIGINNKYLFYITKELDRHGLIEYAEIVAEELNDLQL